MPRTHLMSRLQRCFRLAAAASTPGAPSIDELVAKSRAARSSRRQFLATTAAAAAALAATPLVEAARRVRRASQPRIAIVGAGFAGLQAAYQLGLAGFDATVFEATKRVGGRVFTASDLLAPGLTTELGAEFIDTGHADARSLAAEFGLELLDDNEDPGLAEAYYYNGRHYSEEEVIAEYAPFAPLIQADYDSVPDLVDFRHPGAQQLDGISIAQYLDGLGITGFLRELLDVAYVTEFGRATELQTALNLIFLIGTDVSGGTFEVFGDSDERFRVRGGNQRIAGELAARIPGPILSEHRLEAVSARGRGFTLTFATPGGATDVDADVVVLTLPFSVLRSVALPDLPDFKRRAIDELPYGTNAKLLIGLSERVWRGQGYSGGVFTDESYQSGWDNSRQQPGTAGGFTMYFGGQPGVDVGAGTVAEQVALHVPGLDAAFPGVATAQNGQVGRMHWPTTPFARGSYACYSPGQYNSIAGAEFWPIGNLYFAGEHCSYNYQGYMNGALETGRRAASRIVRRFG